MTVSGKPVPVVAPVAVPYWEAARREELSLQHCARCAAVIFYPRPWCPQCFSLELEYRRVSGRAEVISFSIVYQAPFEAYAPDVPYVLAIVRLVEGPQMMTNIVGCVPDSVHVGMPVEVCFETRAEEFRVPVFRPVS